MGTRGLYCVLQAGEFKVAQYGQWDANPGGQGSVVLDFMRAKVESGTLDAFKDRVRQLTVLTEEAVEEVWLKAGATRHAEFGLTADSETSNRIESDYPSLSRGVCGRILEMVDSGQATAVQLRQDFAADSLFCEWAYVVNLDDSVLEVFKGFQEEAHDKGRFANYEVDESRHGKYWPIAEVSRFRFDNLPDAETFQALCEGGVLDRLAHLEHEPS